MQGAQTNQGLAELTEAEKTRYSRHLILPEVGVEGQQRLRSARVFIAGAGGLGCPAAIYLAAAGVGTIGIADDDVIDLSNLQRQILHSTAAVGTPKTQSIRTKLKELNPEIDVVTHDVRLSAANIESIITGYDVVIDATDNFSTRYLINDACVLHGKPNVYGAIYRFDGQASVFSYRGGPCYRCLFPEPPPPDAVPNCAEGGVLGVLAGLIGVIQATEALKIVLSLGNSLSGRLLLYDATDMRFQTLDIQRQPSCPSCGNNPTIKAVLDTNVHCATTAGAALAGEITPHELQQLLQSKSGVCLLDVRTPAERRICSIPNSKLIPVNELQQRLFELDPSQDVVVYCKSGGRSRTAAELLAANGFSRVRNLSGGILAWIKQIDPEMPSY